MVGRVRLTPLALGHTLTTMWCVKPSPRCLPSLLALWLGLFLAGCLPGAVNLPGVGGDEYERELARWTRKIEVYRRFEAKVFVTATYQAPSFRMAYIRKRTAILGLPEPDRHRLEEEQKRRADAFHEFFVAVYTGDRRWNDLDQPDTIWRVTLQNDRGEQVAPHEIVRVDAKHAEIASFYPYLDAFRKGYFIRFPKTSLELNSPILGPSVRSFKLVLSSSVAVAKLSWEVPSGTKL